MNTSLEITQLLQSWIERFSCTYATHVSEILYDTTLVLLSVEENIEHIYIRAVFNNDRPNDHWVIISCNMKNGILSIIGNPHIACQELLNIRTKSEYTLQKTFFEIAMQSADNYLEFVSLCNAISKHTLLIST